MIFLVVGVLMLACVVSTLGPLRAGARCTPATHRARQVLASACGLLALAGVARIVYFVGLRGHTPWQPSVAMGIAIDVVFAIQAVTLWRPVFPRRPVAVGLAVVCALIAVRALVETWRVFA